MSQMPGDCLGGRGGGGMGGFGIDWYITPRQNPVQVYEATKTLASVSSSFWSFCFFVCLFVFLFALFWRKKVKHCQILRKRIYPWTLPQS